MYAREKIRKRDALFLCFLYIVSGYYENVFEEFVKAIVFFLYSVIIKMLGQGPAYDERKGMIWRI